MKFINEEWLSMKIFPAAPTMVVPYEETYEETAERFTLIWTIKDISIWLMYEPFTRQPYKMATHTHTQTIRRQKPTNYLTVFDHFVELALKGLKVADTNPPRPV